MSALSHKLKGNEHYAAEDYSAAIEEYSKAIILEPTNPVFFTNRANARMKIHQYQGAEEDASRAIDLEPSFKAYYFLGLARTELGYLSSAESSLKKAHESALKDNAASIQVVNALLNVRKLRWEADERSRVAKSSELFAELKTLLEQSTASKLVEAESEFSGSDLQEETLSLKQEHNQKLKSLTQAFAAVSSDPVRDDPPDYLIDPISFNLFVDPVVTKSGNTFERAWILQHLKTSKTDPFSREPLTASDLRPNNQLRAAAEEFMQTHGNF